MIYLLADKQGRVYFLEWINPGWYLIEEDDEFEFEVYWRRFKEPGAVWLDKPEDLEKYVGELKLIATATVYEVEGWLENDKDKEVME